MFFPINFYRGPHFSAESRQTFPWRLILVGFALLLNLLATAAKAHGKDIAVFYALEPDLTQLKGTRPVVRVIQVGTRRIQEFQINGNRVFAVKMGSGPLETAISAQALLARVHCDLAISIGPAGTVSDSMQPGAWFLVSEVRTLDAPHAIWKLEVDPAVSALFHKRANHDLPVCPVASGSEFIARLETRKQIQAATGAAAVEMNLEGLAPVCADHHVPLCAIRIVSDAADEKAAATFRDFVQGYDGAGGRFVASVIEQFAPTADDLEPYPNLRSLTHDDATSKSK